MKRTLSAQLAYMERFGNKDDLLLTAFWTEDDILLALENDDIPEHMHDWAEEHANRLWTEFADNEFNWTWVMDRAYDAMREAIADFLKDAHKGEHDE